MTDPLRRLEVLIEGLDGGGSDFWTALDSSNTPLSKAKDQEIRGFGQLGQFGQSTEEETAVAVIDNAQHTPRTGFDKVNRPRASSILQKGVQTVQAVQKDKESYLDQLVGFGQAVLETVQYRAAAVQNVSPSRPLVMPADWPAGVTHLAEMPVPSGYPVHAWHQLLVDAPRLLEKWSTQAAALGWEDWELFGCHRLTPWRRIDGLGLVPLLQGSTIAALTETDAAIRNASGSVLTFRRRQRDALHPVERCLLWDLEAGPSEHGSPPALYDHPITRSGKP